MRHPTVHEIESANTTDQLVLMLYNLSDSVARSQSVTDKLVQLMASDDVLVRFVSARILSRIFMDTSPSQVLDIMLQAIRNPVPLRIALNKLYPMLQIPGSSVVHLACISTCLVAKNSSEKAVPTLIEAIDKHSASDATTISHALLYLVFHNYSNRPVRLLELSDTQRQVIQTVANSKFAWRLNGNMEISLKQFGLPTNKKQLLDFLDGAKS